MDEFNQQNLGPVPPVMPLFALPDHVLLPSVPGPYRIFEPRYVAMLRDLLKSPPQRQWIAISRLIPSDNAAEEPAFEPVGTAARLLAAKPASSDAHFEIIVVGGQRVRLTALPSSRGYPLVKVEPICENPLPEELPDLLDGLSQTLVGLMALMGPSSGVLQELVGDRSDPQRLVYRLGAMLIRQPDGLQRFLECPDIAARVKLVEDALTETVAQVHRVQEASPLRAVS